MLPYPSGDLHIGHWYAMTPSDARARYKRMNGYNVMFPIGFDAFGLPAENAAIKRGIHPKKWTYAQHRATCASSCARMGAMFDWRREAVSADPEYYKWTQWFFIQLYKHGLAYRKMSPVDLVPALQHHPGARAGRGARTAHCERCGTPVIKKDLDQWFFRITKYADELLNYDGIDWPERVRTLQTNWIGRSEGASVVFKTEAGRRHRGLHHPARHAVGRHLHGAGPRASAGGQADHAPSTGRPWRPTSSRLPASPISSARPPTRRRPASSPAPMPSTRSTAAKIPIWIADYVLMTYGTGAIMAVPAHDERDFAFARKFGLKIIPVIQPDGRA